jgi:hypothetical protein
MSRWYRERTTWLVPIVVCLVALLETIVSYKVHEWVKDLRWRAAIILALNGIGFGIAAGWIVPWMSHLLGKLRRESSEAGVVFIWVFYAACYGLLFYAYYIVEKYGPGGLLPASLR